MVVNVHHRRGGPVANGGRIRVPVLVLRGQHFSLFLFPFVHFHEGLPRADNALQPHGRRVAVFTDLFVELELFWVHRLGAPVAARGVGTGIMPSHSLIFVSCLFLVEGAG